MQVCHSLPLGWLLHRQVQVLGCIQVSCLPSLLHRTGKVPDISTLVLFLFSFLIFLILKPYKDFFASLIAIDLFCQKWESKRRFTKSRSSTVPSIQHFCKAWRVLLFAIEICLPATRGTTHLPQKPTRFRSWQRIRQPDQQQLQSYRHQTAHIKQKLYQFLQWYLTASVSLKR